MHQTQSDLIARKYVVVHFNIAGYGKIGEVQPKSAVRIVHERVICDSDVADEWVRNEQAIAGGVHEMIVPNCNIRSLEIGDCQCSSHKVILFNGECSRQVAKSNRA